MIDVIIKGTVLGLLLSVYIGITNIMLLETSLNRGFKAAMTLNIGITLSDAIFILIGVYFSETILHLFSDNIYFRIIGGVILIGFGLHSIFSVQNFEEKVIHTNFTHGVFFMKGFLINTLNPAVPLLWLGSLSVVIAKYSYSRSNVIIFFSFTLLTFFLINILKIYLAGKLKKIIHSKILEYFFKLIGLGLVVYGLTIIF